MINELYGLAVTLQEKGISLQDWHGEYKPIPKVTKKSPCIRVWMAGNGVICDLESIDEELAQSLRKYGNNQGSFPAFNILPLYRITDKNAISCLDSLRKGSIKPDVEKIKSCCMNLNWKQKNIKKINRCLNDISKKMFKIIDESESNKGNVVSELICLVHEFSNESGELAISFRNSLENCIFLKLEKCEDIDILLSLLFHVGDEKKSPEEDEGANISVILDVQNWEKYKHPVASEYTTRWLNNALLLYAPENTTSVVDNSVDAFGTNFHNPNKKMDEVKLSSFNIILRSMFNEKPCQYRYQKIEDGSYPIAIENRTIVKSSLEWIADLEREGITWRKVDKNEIIFVYPSRIPKIPPKFTSIFGTSNIDSSALDESRFESIAKEFTRTIEGVPPYEKFDSIRIFTIRKIDKGRSKVIFSHNTTPQHLVNCANAWREANYNLPNMSFGKHIVPYPLQVSTIINNVWKQDGEIAQGKAKVERMKYYQGIELMLDILPKDIVRNFLHILINNSSGLIYYIGNLYHAGAKYKDNNEEKKLDRQKEESKMVISVLGLLLYKCDIRKENYMENMAYLIGQLLHISDEIHTLYCNVVRNGDIPPQLVGNSMFLTARETPYLAISQLSVRLNPYIVWAKQYRYKNVNEKNKESWRTGWYLSLFEETANKLNKVMTDSTRFNDYEKAQIFIGYMASFPKSET